MATMAASLDFQLERFLFIYLFIYLFMFDYKSPLYFLPRFKSIGLSIQKKKRKTDFQDAAILYFR